MNANELANLMEDMYPSVATMLRQLQAENEAVKESNKNLMELVTMLREEVDLLRPYKEKVEAMERAYDRHFEAALRADDVWKRATGRKP